MTKQFSCTDMGAANCKFTTTAKDEPSLIRKVREHITKVHKEIKNFDSGVEAKVKSVIKEV